MVTVSAPGKVHLIGEHAVVYGHPAIIAAVGCRIYIEAKKSDRVELKDVRYNRNLNWAVDEVKNYAKYARSLWEKCQKNGDFSEIVSWSKDSGSYGNFWKAAFGILLDMTSAESGISLHVVKSDIPVASGMGSSSATAVAMAKACSEIYGKNLNLEKINEVAFEIEKIAHGNPSGGDNTACCYGGIVWFQKSQPKNIIIPLKDEISHKLENFVFVYTKRPEKSTGELVQMVREIPETVRMPKMEELEKMTHELKTALKQKNYEKTKAIINRTNEILASFGLSVPETEEICKRVVSLDGAAKMCGACGGGTVLAWHKNPKLIIEAIQDLGYKPFEADIAVEGVRIEN